MKLIELFMLCENSSLTSIMMKYPYGHNLIKTIHNSYNRFIDHKPEIRDITSKFINNHNAVQNIVNNEILVVLGSKAALVKYMTRYEISIPDQLVFKDGISKNYDLYQTSIDRINVLVGHIDKVIVIKPNVTVNTIHQPSVRPYKNLQYKKLIQRTYPHLRKMIDELINELSEINKRHNQPKLEKYIQRLNKLKNNMPDISNKIDRGRDTTAIIKIQDLIEKAIQTTIPYIRKNSNYTDTKEYEKYIEELIHGSIDTYHIFLQFLKQELRTISKL